MIGSFWNFCRCPAMLPVDKFHSEYRSTYRWHEFGQAGPEVIKKPPVPNQFAPANEPPLPRRKKCPELAYRSHEFMSAADQSGHDRTDSVAPNNRARSEERGTPSRRSKSEGPPNPGIPNGRCLTGTGLAGDKGFASKQAGESSGLFKKTISKLSTEYRLQFVWKTIDTPRKSLSMGAIKSTHLPTIHKKRTTNEKEAKAHELEPLVNEVEEKHNEINKQEKNAMDNKKVAIDKEKFGFEPEKSSRDNKLANGGIPGYDKTWYKEVVELRKKAGQYKCRGWGVEINNDLYKKQMDLWDQVSMRSSLSALSLASAVRPITKEEKELENEKKSSPTKPAGRSRYPGQARLVDNKAVTDAITLGKIKRDAIRHHLERTTGPEAEEGALLPSPTREKLMPTIPRSKGDSPQRGSPSKSASSKLESPKKGSPLKSPKKTTQARSQSVGPTVPEGSPKKQIRSGSSATAATASSQAKSHKKSNATTPSSTVAPGDRKPRPTSLYTSVHTRSKSNSVPARVRAQSAPINNQIQCQTTTTTTTTTTTNQSQTKPVQPMHSNDPNRVDNKEKTVEHSSYPPPRHSLHIPNLKKSYKPYKPPTSKDIKSSLNGSMSESIAKRSQQKDLGKKTAKNEDGATDDNEIGVSISSASPQPPLEAIEHIVKSPPEPTRVKSPEQILMRSPDPVNWTVPLDTGKTFTVTQKVKEGDIVRPHSEFKASTPIDHLPVPATACFSAPPELAEQAKLQAERVDTDSTNKPSGSDADTKAAFKPVPGSTIRCLDDPTFESDINSPSGSRNATEDVLESARDRFDRFWGNTSAN